MAKNPSPSFGIDPGRIKLVHDSKTKLFDDLSNSDRITTDYRIEYASLQDGQRLQFWDKGKWVDKQPSPLKQLHQHAQSRDGNGLYKNFINQFVRLVDQNGDFSPHINFTFSLLGYSHGRLSSGNESFLALAQDTGKDGDKLTTNPQIISKHKTFDNVQFYVDGAWQDEQPKPRDGFNGLYARLVHRDHKVLAHTRTYQFDFNYLNLPAPKLKLSESSSTDSDNLIIQDTKFKFSNLVHHKNLGTAWVEYQVDDEWLRELPNLSAGEHSIPVRQRLDDGHISPIEKLNFTLVQSVVLPAPDIKLKNDTGNSETDLRTNDGELKIGGLVKGAIAQYLWSDNEWRDKVPVPEKGKNSIQVRQKDAEGNTSESTQFEFTLLELIELPAPDVKLKNDTGNSDTDRRTHDPELKIGGLVDGATVEYQWGKDEWRDKPPVFKDGSNLIKVRQRDSSENISKISSFEFTLLRKQELQSLVINLKNDTGWHESNPEWGSDLITTDPALQISGRAKGAEIEYKFDQYKGYGEPNNGLWSKWKSEWDDNYKWKSYHWQYPVDFGGDINTFSSSVENTIHFRQVDPDGNMSKETSFTFNFYPDLDRGDGFPSPSLSVKNDMSYVSPNRQSWWGGRSRDHELVINPKPQEGEFYEWKGPRATTWSATYPPLDDFSVGGKNTVWVRRRDSVGNISSPRYLTFDLEAAPKRATAPSLSLKNDTGIDDDHVTTEMGLVVAGYFGDSQLSFRHSYRESEFAQPTSDDQWDDIPNLSKPSHVQNYIDSKIRKLTKPGYYTFEVKKEYDDSVSYSEFKKITSPISTLNVQLVGDGSSSNSATNDIPNYTPNKNPETLPYNRGGKGHKEDTGLGGFFSMARDSGDSQFDKRTDYMVTDMFELHLKEPAIVGSGYQYQVNGSPWLLMRAPNPLSDLRKWVLPWHEAFNEPGENTILIRYFDGANDYFSEPYVYQCYLGDDSVQQEEVSVEQEEDRPTYTPNKNPETIPVAFGSKLGHKEDTGLGAFFMMNNDTGSSQIDKRTNTPHYFELVFLVQDEAVPAESGYQYQMNGSSWRDMRAPGYEDDKRWRFPANSPYWAGENTISIRYFDGANDYFSEPYVYQWYLGDDTSEPAASASQQSIAYDLDEDVVEYWEDTGLGFKVKLKDDLGYSSTDKVTSSDQLEIIFTDQVDGNFTIEYKHSQADEWSLLADAASFSVGESVDSSHSFGSVVGANTLLLRRINSDGSESSPYSFAYTYDVDATSVFGSDQLTGNSLASTFSNALPESSVERFSLFSRFVLSNRPAFRDKLADSIIDFYPSTGDQLLMDRDWIQAKSRKNLLAVVHGRRAEKQASKSNTSLVYNQKTGDLFLNGNGDRSGWGKPKIGGLLVELDSYLILHEANIVLI